MKDDQDPANAIRRSIDGYQVSQAIHVAHARHRRSPRGRSPHELNSLRLPLSRTDALPYAARPRERRCPARA